MTARRINRGRGHSYELDGRRVDGITTVLRGGIPKPAFIEAAAKTAAGYAVDHWDELAELTPSQRLERIKRARQEALNAAGVRGTDVHKIAQRLAGGEEVDVPEAYRGHVESYLRFVEEWQPEELYVERPVFSRQWQYAGTPDLFARLADGRLWLLDWKTAESGIWPEAALQLAAARYAEFILDDAEIEQPIPEVDACAGISLRADGYDLVPVEADEETFRYFLWARRIHEFTKEPRERWVMDALQAPERSAT